MNMLQMNSPLGRLRVVVESGQIRRLDFHWGFGAAENAIGENSLTRLIQQQLTDYFHHAKPLNGLPHAARGTPFQQRVWQALEEIPLGEVITYGELAAALNSSPRAVGGACRSNPIPLLIPCHRVVAKAAIGGFGGSWGSGERVEIKSWLLRHEGVRGFADDGDRGRG